MKGKQTEQYMIFPDSVPLASDAGQQAKAANNTASCHKHPEQDRGDRLSCQNGVCLTAWKPQQKH